MYQSLPLRWASFLHPEIEKKKRRPPSRPIKRRIGPEWNLSLPWFEYKLPGWVWKGNGWMLVEDSQGRIGRMRLEPGCIAPGSKVFVGRGQVKVPRKRKAAGEGPPAPGSAAAPSIRPTEW